MLEPVMRSILPVLILMFGSQAGAEMLCDGGTTAFRVKEGTLPTYTKSGKEICIDLSKSKGLFCKAVIMMNADLGSYAKYDDSYYNQRPVYENFAKLTNFILDEADIFFLVSADWYQLSEAGPTGSISEAIELIGISDASAQLKTLSGKSESFGVQTTYLLNRENLNLTTTVKIADNSTNIISKCWVEDADYSLRTYQKNAFNSLQFIEQQNEEQRKQSKF